MAGRQDKGSEDDLCKRCRYWHPSLLTDSLGMIRGCRCCFSSNPQNDHSCFAATVEDETGENQQNEAENATVNTPAFGKEPDDQVR